MHIYIYIYYCNDKWQLTKYSLKYKSFHFTWLELNCLPLYWCVTGHADYDYFVLGITSEDKFQTVSKMYSNVAQDNLFQNFNKEKLLNTQEKQDDIWKARRCSWFKKNTLDTQSLLICM